MINLQNDDNQINQNVPVISTAATTAATSSSSDSFTSAADANKRNPCMSDGVLQNPRSRVRARAISPTNLTDVDLARETTASKRLRV